MECLPAFSLYGGPLAKLPYYSSCVDYCCYELSGYNTKVHDLICKWEGTCHSVLQARLLGDDTHAYILMDSEGGIRVSAPRSRWKRAPGDSRFWSIAQICFCISLTNSHNMILLIL